MFHVKHAQGYQAKMCLHIFIWEPQGVGLWLRQRPNILISFCSAVDHLM